MPYENRIIFKDSFPSNGSNDTSQSQHAVDGRRQLTGKYKNTEDIIVWTPSTDISDNIE